MAIRFTPRCERLPADRDMPGWDDMQSSAAVLSSRLVSAVGASVSDGPVRPARTPRGWRLEL
jgi:hypothetical protein